MSNQLLVSTRKGLFVVGRGNDGWRVKQVSFIGQNATLALPANGRGWFAALNLGHFGVKLHHSADEGRTWEERAVPTYPEGENVVLGDGKPPRPFRVGSKVGDNYVLQSVGLRSATLGEIDNKVAALLAAVERANQGLGR